MLKNEYIRAWGGAALLVIIFIALLNILSNDPESTWPLFVIVVGTLVLFVLIQPRKK